METIIFFLEILGTVAFSVSGAIEAMKKGMDFLGVIVLGLVTAVGGGVVRDIVTGKFPPEAFENPMMAGIAIATAVLSFVVGMLLSRRERKGSFAVWNSVLLISDAIGLAAFTILGIRCVQDRLGSDNLALLLFVGVVTGIGGGMMRDVLAGNVPYVFRKHVYATASIAGAVVYLLLGCTVIQELAVAGSMVTVLAIRLLAAHYKWNLPKVTLQ